MKINLCMLLLLAIVAAKPDSSLPKNSRNKRALSESFSPITYVQKSAKPVSDARIVQPQQKKGKKTDKHNSLMSNHELLSSIGLGKMPTPSNHHRKRLASQSRHVGRPDDSRIFIVKLPPNPHYYSQNNFLPTKEQNSIDDRSKKIPVGFKSNGKPAAIYHWNLPVLSKMISGSNSRSNSKRYKGSDNDVFDLIDVKDIPTWSDSSNSLWHDNDDKISALTYNVFQDSEQSKILKKKSAPSFYVPLEKQKTQKYFPSNGKPKGFYIMKNSKSEKSFHNLIN